MKLYVTNKAKELKKQRNRKRGIGFTSWNEATAVHPKMRNVAYDLIHAKVLPEKKKIKEEKAVLCWDLIHHCLHIPRLGRGIKEHQDPTLC